MNKKIVSIAKNNKVLQVLNKLEETTDNKESSSLSNRSLVGRMQSEDVIWNNDIDREYFNNIRVYRIPGLNEKLIEVGVENYSDVIMIPADKDYFIYSEGIRNCSALIMRLEDEKGVPYLLFSHINVLNLDISMPYILKNIPHNLVPKEIVFSPREDSRDRKNAEKMLREFAKKHKAELSIIIRPECQDDKKKATTTSVLVSTQGWAMKSPGTSSADKIFKNWSTSLSLGVNFVRKLTPR